MSIHKIAAGDFGRTIGKLDPSRQNLIFLCRSEMFGERFKPVSIWRVNFGGPSFDDYFD
jgi:hypothetical protein